MDPSLRLLSLGITPALVLLTALAGAQQPAAAPAPSGGSQPLTHDGFYLSGALGFGRMRDDMELTIDILGFGREYEGHAEGFSIAGHLFAGFTVTKALVVGGGVFVEQVTDPEIEVDNNDVGDDVSVGTLALVGPGVVWYPKKEGVTRARRGSSIAW